MHWYWILLLCFWGAGAPWGIKFVIEYRVHYYDAVFCGLDLIFLLIVNLVLWAVMMALGWIFAVFYGVRTLYHRWRGT